MHLNTLNLTEAETLTTDVVSANVVLMGHSMTMGSVPDPRPHFLLCDEEEEDFAKVEDNPFWMDEPSELVF